MTCLLNMNGKNNELENFGMRNAESKERKLDQAVPSIDLNHSFQIFDYEI